MKKFILRLKRSITEFLSHRPGLYAFMVGLGIVLFWRGVWHTVDHFHTYLSYYQGNSTIDYFMSPWWDGPISLLVGCVLLYFTGAFVSSFIGNELILSGLRGEKGIAKKTESELENEILDISEIKRALRDIEKKLVQLETKVHLHHSSD
jgi:hypothetical protein